MNVKMTDYQPSIMNEEGINFVDCAPIDAQPWCNFIVFTMGSLPKGFFIVKQQLRKESQKSQSSFRIVLENEKSKQIAIKQFLYDWAPPAYDYPCLWLNTGAFSATNVLAPRGINVGNRLLWIGKNYRGQNAATIDCERTRIEVTFDNIDLLDEDLIIMIQDLRSCDEKIKKQILSTPFSHLSYYYRHKINTSEVPLSFWRHIRHKSCFTITLPTEEKITHKWLPDTLQDTLGKEGYYLNGIIGISEPHGNIVEKEYLFEHHQHAGVFIHILVAPNTSIYPIQFPPLIGDQICEHEIIDEGDGVHLAYSYQRKGNFELAWKSDGLIYLMIIRAAKWTSAEWALNVIKKLT